MSLFQVEADLLLQMPKVFEQGTNQIDFPRLQALSAEYTLEGVGTRERFLLDLDRGDRKRARLKFQTRARKIYILARIDIEGRPHRNPIDAPHRPNERFTDTHVHLYREGFADRVAFLPADLKGFEVPNDGTDISWLVAFLHFCNVTSIPPIQEGI
ncbi:MAG: hypothetical protein ABIQ12_00530 [Opitutaceae bacterium]